MKDFSRYFDRTAPCYSATPATIASNLPKRMKRFALEFMGVAGASFALSVVLAANSGDLKEYRAYFLSSGKDFATAAMIGWIGFRVTATKKESR